jgi:hypothetical protein
VRRSREQRGWLRPNEPAAARRSIIGAMSEASDPAPGSDLDALGLSDDEKAVLAKVGVILRRLSFGTVVLVVQDGKVVQIEMAEKFRLR